MKSRKLVVGMLSLLACSVGLAWEGPRQTQDWLTGDWVLCEDPDNGPKETLRFSANGTGMVIRAKGNIEFLHKHSAHSVSLLANANGYAIPIELASSPDFDKLLLYSEKTKNTATYVRSDDNEASSCSIK